MVHLTFHERRILRGLERRLAGDSRLAALAAQLERQPGRLPSATAQRRRAVAAVTTGCPVGAVLVAAYLWGGWALLVFAAVVMLVCGAPLWDHRRRAPTRATGGVAYWRTKKPSPRMWIRWHAQRHLTRPRP